jgi:AraC family transcriptional activator of pobA
MIADIKDNILRLEDKLGDVPFYAARCYEEIKKTSPHKHENYYELVYLKEGEGFHWIEENQYLITAPELYFLIPWQVHHWQFTSIPKGIVILFKKSYFDEVDDRHILHMISKLSGRFRVGIPAGYTPEPILQSILDEFSSNTEFSEKIIHGLLAALFAKILQFSSVQFEEKKVPGNLYEKYQELIFKECPYLYKVKDFARLLNTTPQNLNAACRRQNDKTAKDLILYQLNLEAKRYLLYTDKTLSEISEILPFNDTSYFVKFFKKQEGLTPRQFRRKYFQ